MIKNLLLTLSLLSVVACVHQVDDLTSDTDGGDEVVYTLEAGTYTDILLDVPIYYTVHCFSLWDVIAIVDTYGQFDLMLSFISDEDAIDLNERLIAHGRAYCNGDEE